MNKKIYSFYDWLVWLFTCGPLLVLFFILAYYITLHEMEWRIANWYYIIACGLCFAISSIGVVYTRSIEISEDLVRFHFGFNIVGRLAKGARNIDVHWNHNVCISEVLKTEIVSLSEQERQEKVYYKHWFNKYLKITLHYGKEKYVYVGNYSKHQIKKIIKILTEPQFR